jgi:hypothetical protein
LEVGDAVHQRVVNTIIAVLEDLIVNAENVDLAYLRIRGWIFDQDGINLRIENIENQLGQILQILGQPGGGRGGGRGGRGRGGRN